eukprot:2759252-Pleurochrysis_carterae.AAC.4
MSEEGCALAFIMSGTRHRQAAVLYVAWQAAAHHSTSQHSITAQTAQEQRRFQPGAGQPAIQHAPNVRHARTQAVHSAFAVLLGLDRTEPQRVVWTEPAGRQSNHNLALITACTG